MEEKFQDSLLHYYAHFKQYLDRKETRDSDLSWNIDMQLALYCKNLIALAKKIVPEFPEMSSHLARCFLEVEIILKWLKQDPVNYHIFCADAEFSNLRLMKTKKELAKNIDNKLVGEFENHILELETNLKNGRHNQFRDKVSPLYEIKGTAKKIDANLGAHVSAYFDYYSKMSHPTAWLIMTNPKELPYIRNEAMLGIQRSVIEILNTLSETASVS